MIRRNFLRTVAGGSAVAIAGCMGNGDDGGDETTEPSSGGGDSTTAASSDSGSDSDSGGGTDLPDQMNLGLSSPARGVFSFPLWPGLQRRLEEQGSSMSAEAFSGHTPTAGALVQGDIVTGYMGLPSLLKAQQEGLPLVAIHSFMQEYNFPMVAQPDITSWDQLEGGTIAIHAPTGATSVISQYMLNEELGSTDSVELTYIVGSGNRASALRAGDVDATCLLASPGEQLSVTGNGNILAYPQDYEGLSNMLTNVWVALEPDLEERSDSLQVFVDEMQASYSRMFEGDHETIISEAEESGEYPDYEQEAWSNALEIATDSPPLWPESKETSLPAENIERTQDLLVDIGEIEEETAKPVSEIVDRRFLE
ncbi:ABC transporter substrate-binding protein [Halobellus salinisoli]|uniref:ABC transporter substrate-binding protein n=1 Tax=Halobellus salinisoli TaxID=3108500 RepID=UPI00300B02FF